MLKRNLLVLIGGIALLTSGAYEPAFALVKNLKDSIKKQTTVIRNWGLDNDEFESHINARKAWALSEGSKKVVVAVIDTGIDASHPDLKDNLWKKPGSTDEYGFDFVTNKKNPNDTHGHGTHVAGIIAGHGSSGGIKGVAPNVSIMAVRYYSESVSGTDNLNNTIKAFNYAIDNGAQIINYSGGGAEYSAAEFKAIQRAEAKGIIVVAAAGNEYQNTDLPQNHYYPGDYGLSNIITVAATNIRNQLLPSSNWGLKNVHIAAPGENIYSSLPKGRFGYLSGTSQATAFVTGVAALILSENPNLKPQEVREIIMRSADHLDTLKSKVSSGGRLNAFSAVQNVVLAKTGELAKVKVTAADLPKDAETPSQAHRKVAKQ